MRGAAKANAQRGRMVANRRRTYGALWGSLRPSPVPPADPPMHPDCLDCGCQYAAMRGYPECPGQCAALPYTVKGN
jgi:hypothetical protein